MNIREIRSQKEEWFLNNCWTVIKSSHCQKWERRQPKNVTRSWGNISETALCSQTLIDLFFNYFSLAPKPAKVCEPRPPHQMDCSQVPLYYYLFQGSLKRKKKAQQREPFFLFWQWCVSPWQAALLLNVVSTLELSMAFVMCLSWLAPWVTLASKAAFLLTACWGYRCLDNR